MPRPLTPTVLELQKTFELRGESNRRFSRMCQGISFLKLRLFLARSGGWGHFDRLLGHVRNVGGREMVFTWVCAFLLFASGDMAWSSYSHSRWVPLRGSQPSRSRCAIPMCPAKRHSAGRFIYSEPLGTAITDQPCWYQWISPSRIHQLGGCYPPP